MQCELSLKEGTPISMTECLLDWRRCHAAVYPNLSKLEKCYLDVSATSLPSERVFSADGNNGAKGGLSLRARRLAGPWLTQEVCPHQCGVHL